MTRALEKKQKNTAARLTLFHIFCRDHGICHSKYHTVSDFSRASHSWNIFIFPNKQTYFQSLQYHYEWFYGKLVIRSILTRFAFLTPIFTIISARLLEPYFLEGSVLQFMSFLPFTSCPAQYCGTIKQKVMNELISRNTFRWRKINDTDDVIARYSSFVIACRHASSGDIHMCYFFFKSFYL